MLGDHAAVGMPHLLGSPIDLGNTFGLLDGRRRAGTEEGLEKGIFFGST